MSLHNQGRPSFLIWGGRGEGNLGIPMFILWGNLYIKKARTSKLFIFFFFGGGERGRLKIKNLKIMGLPQIN